MTQLTFSSNVYWNICFKFCILEQIIATVLFICISSINNKRSLLRFQSTTVPTNRRWSACGATAMIESLRTTQIAFFRFAAPSGFLGAGVETRNKKYSCKGPCKEKSCETIFENIVSRYQTLVSSLPREAVFLHRRPKTEFITEPHRQPSNYIRRNKT